MSISTPTANDIRDWMRINARGYAAAARHFDLPGGEQEARSICAVEPRARARVVEDTEPPTPRPKRAAAQPPQLPAVQAPLVEPPLTELSNRLIWVRAKLQEVELFLAGAPAHAAAALLRVAAEFKNQEVQILHQLKEEDASKLSEEDALELASEQARRLPDALLELFVKEYIERHRLKLERNDS